MLEEHTYPTIREWFDGVLDNRDIRIFKFALYGNCYAGNPKTKKPTRVSIVIPKDIAEDNLKFLQEWSFLGIAIPKKVIDSLTEEDSQ